MVAKFGQWPSYILKGRKYPSQPWQYVVLYHKDGGLKVWNFWKEEPWDWNAAVPLSFFPAAYSFKVIDKDGVFIELL